MNWFTSDLHFGHANIIEFSLRPFVSVEHMNEALVKNWNSVINGDDTVFIIGDFAMGRIEDTLPLAARLAGDKFLILGNHDRPWQGNSAKKRERWTREYASYFTLVNGPTEYELSTGERVILSHFPRKDVSRHGGKFSAYEPPPGEQWVIHGHTHSSDVCDPAQREIHVGIDAWDYFPVREDWIEGLIAQHG